MSDISECEPYEEPVLPRAYLARVSFLAFVFAASLPPIVHRACQ